MILAKFSFNQNSLHIYCLLLDWVQVFSQQQTSGTISVSVNSFLQIKTGNEVLWILLDFQTYQNKYFPIKKPKFEKVTGQMKNGSKKPVRQKISNQILRFGLSAKYCTISIFFKKHHLDIKTNDLPAKMFLETPLNQVIPQDGIDFDENKNLDTFIECIVSLKINPFLITLECPPNQFSQNSVSDDEGRNCANPKKILTYNRKQKSLAELTKKFIQKFQGAECSYLALDQVTQEMKVERRRIYDIINIMQSLNVVTKKKKNIYKWKGLKQAVETIQNLSKNQKQNPEVLLRSRKEKSLELLATYFLKVFSQKKEVLTLEKASEYIINDESEKESKTKVRRLYDIVNVFKSLGLIKKIKNQGAKPGYEWMGCENLNKIIEDKRRDYLNQSVEAQQGLLGEKIDYNSSYFNQLKESIEQPEIECQKNKIIEEKDLIDNWEERKEIMMDQTAYKKRLKNQEYEKQVSIFNEIEDHSSFLCSILCRQRENGVKTLKEFIEKFDRNLWKNDLSSFKKQKQREQEKEMYANGFRTNKIVCET